MCLSVRPHHRLGECYTLNNITFVIKNISAACISAVAENTAMNMSAEFSLQSFALILWETCQVWTFWIMQ